MNILAIDLGKFNSMCCFFDTKTQQHRFQAAATTRRYLTAILKNHKIDLVVMEACGPSGWICDLCQEHNLKTLACSTNEEAWRWANVKRKTDKDDALKLARLAMMRQLKPVHVPQHEVREHRTLVKYRKTLDQRINRIKNSIRSLFANRGIER
jgi:transposase